MDQIGFGKLLLDKQGGSGFYVAAVIFIVLGCLELLSFVAVDQLAMKIFAFVFGPAMIAAGIFCLRSGGKRLVVFERGITDTKIAIPFEQISSYSFNLQDISIAGIHTETLITFWFIPKFPAGRLQFRFTFQEKGEIDALIQVTHNHITARLAESMLWELRAGRQVAWTKSLTFTPEGLEYPGPGGTAKNARYADIAEPVVESLHIMNKVRLTARGTDLVLATLTPDELNYYPGMLVLEKMRAANAGW